MGSDKENAYQTITQLIERFEEQLPSYKRSDYNEALVRKDFIDPFFKALGWDIDNSQGYAEAYREVIHEDRVKVGAATKAPDYSFRLPGGKRLFFVEAKKPSVYIKEDVLPAYQVRRYGWSAKLPVSIVTDFEEFALYDCIKKPAVTDKASTARIKYFTYKEYLNQFDFLWDTFSKEKVLRGGLDKFVISDKIKKGTATVDKEFLKSLDEWRKELALNIALRNDVNHDELNFVVQALLDRLIFLRIAEDRAIEPYGSLRDSTISIGGEKNIVYTRLLKLFTEADSKYNSGIFNFKQDRISKTLLIDNGTLRKIVQQLYYPESPYEFSVINVEILGSAYEQFLGKQIVLKGAHKAAIEEKPEVRKAGGVYYTPQYIVDYIVENTVGKLIAERTKGLAFDKAVKEVEKIKIVDPACGSGSFLLGAYQYILNWYIKAKHDAGFLYDGTITYDGKKKTKTFNITAPDGRLTTAIKKQVLLNNIFGVDIDVNAVEVTKLSLLLKCLEGETEASISTQLRLFNDRVLPTLEDNIKNGNSLIDVDFYEQFPGADTYAVKPFSWKDNFKEVFTSLRGGTTKQSADSGFDIVIGNPPYRLMQPKDTDEKLLGYFKRHYNVAEFKIDLFHLFYQQAVNVLNQNGLLGFITPSSILNNVYAESLRSWLLDKCRLDTIALTKEKVFSDADVYTSVFIFEKNDNKKITNENLVRTTIELERVKSNNELNYSVVKQERFNQLQGKVWNILLNEENISIINKINKASILLKDIATINRGLITGDRNKYFSNKKISDKYVPILAGGDVYRYYTNPVNEYVLFERPKTSGGSWDKEVHFAKHKILIRQIGFKPTASFISEPIAVTGNIFTVRSDSVDSDKYILAIINSKLIEYYWQIMFADFKNSFPQVTIFSLNQIPIKISTDSLREKLIKLIDTMLQLNQQLQQTTLPQQQEQLKQRIAFTDKKIDALVYELYGLSEEEVKIAEGT